MRSTSLLNHSVIVAAAAWSFLAGLTLGAQPAADQFFHQGAQQYLATNGMAQARLSVTNGLKLYPNDEKLKKLWELLNQQQQQQNKDDQKQEQDKKDQESKDQQSKDQQKQGDEKKDQQKKSEEQKKQEQEQQKQDQASQQDKKDGDKKDGQKAKPEKGGEPQNGEGTPQAAQAMRMTPQQAIQLLEALKGEEKAMPFKPVMKTNRQDRVFKDW